jgi:hypothetical protein
MSSLNSLNVAIDAVITAATQNDQATLVTRLNEVDALLVDATTESWVKARALDVLRQHPEAFKSINFAGSLVSGPQSAFVRVVLVGLAERFPQLTDDEALLVIESCRRNKRYDEMQRYVVLLGDRGSTEYALRTRLFYELHMARYQQGKDVEATDDAKALGFYNDSLQYAELSAQNARAADNILDGLFAEMNISGLLLPKLGKWQEALIRSEKVSADALLEVAKTQDKHTLDRAWRVHMNAAAHRIKIAVVHQIPNADVQRWHDDLMANPMFLAAKDQDWAVAVLALVEGYLTEK